MADEIVGSAYVVLRAITSKIKDDIRDGVKKGANSAKRDLEDAGTTIGETVGEAAGDAAGAGVTDGIERSSRRDRGRHRAIGGGIGRSIVSGMGRGMRTVSRTVSRALTAGGKLMDAAKDIGAGIGDNIKKGLAGIKMPSLGALGMGALVAIIPLVTSLLSSLSGGLVAFIGSAAQASYASFALVGILGTLKQTTAVLKIATGGLTEALAGEEGAMAKLAPSAQEVVKSLKALTPEWAAMKKQVQGAALAGIGPVLDKLGENTLPVLRKGLVGTGTQLNTIFKELGKFATSASFTERFGLALKGNNRILEILGKAAVPILNGILNVYNALLPAARKLGWMIVQNARQFSRWSESGKAMDGLMEKFNRGRVAALRLWRIARNLGSVLKNVFGAAVKPGDNLLKTFVKLTGRLKRFTELGSTKNAIAEWAQKGIDVSGRFFKGLGKGFKLIAPLFNPDIASGFFDVFEKAMPIISSVVGVIQGALAPVLSSIGDALAENGPKFAALFEAIAPLLKGVGSVIGEIISQALDLLGTIAAVITPVVKAISGFVGPLLTRFAPIIATIILALGPQGFAGALVKLVPIIGRFLAPLVNLAGWLLRVMGPAFKFVGKIVVGSFKLIWKIISSVLGFVFKLIGKVFGFIFKYVPNVIKNVVGAVGRGFTSMKNTVSKIVGDIWGAIKSGFDRVMDFIGGLPGKLLRLAVTFLNAGTELGKKIIAGLQAGVLGAAGLITDIAGNVWDAVRSFLNGAISKINAALEFNISIPGPDISINPPNIPMLAGGGRATGGTLAYIGEGKEAETVLPDSLLGDLLEKAHGAGQSKGTGRGSVNVINNIYNPEPERASKSVGTKLRDVSTEAGWKM